MKREFTFIIITLFLINFTVATQNNSQVQANTKQTIATAQIQTKSISADKVKEIIQNRNRLRINQTSECPERCACSGSVISCRSAQGKEITIRAGNSGNTIVQVRGAEVQTKAELYQSNGKFYGIFKNNQTKEIKVLPDQIREKVRERLNNSNSTYNMTLDADGNYEIQTQQRARLLGFIKVQQRLKIQVNSETGEITQTKKPWWSFLASTDEE